MKVILVCLALLFLAPLDAAPVEAQTARRPAAASLAFWPQRSTINVYFLKDMFTPEEKKSVLAAMESWMQRSDSKRPDLRLVYAGETGGLVDCAACLTITLQNVYTNNGTERTSFNRLRQDETGRLSSAWIALDRATATPRALKDLILKALDRGYGN